MIFYIDLKTPKSIIFKEDLVVILKIHETFDVLMSEYSQSWRRRLRLQLLVDIAKKDLNSGNNFNDVFLKLDKEMQDRWKMVPSTRKNYLEMIRKVLDNKFVVTPQISYN